MDDNAKHASSYQHDQEILDARGINMTVEEVAGLPTCKYSERVQALNLNEDDLIFLKGLRRRIRNRLASQNSRRRSMENLRRLTRELRAVRACRDDIIAERRGLVATRAALRAQCVGLRTHILRILQDRSDPSDVPDLEPERISASQPESLLTSQVFECRIDKLVQQSVNHIYKGKDRISLNKINDKSDQLGYKCHQHVYIMDQHGDDMYKVGHKDIHKLDREDLLRVKQEGKKERVCAKTVFIGDGDEVLNLSKKRSHGRKQPAPRRITYVFTEPDQDGVLDLKIKREPE